MAEKEKQTDTGWEFIYGTIGLTFIFILFVIAANKYVAEFSGGLVLVAAIGLSFVSALALSCIRRVRKIFSRVAAILNSWP